MRKVILHCSATKEGQDISTETIREWHIKKKWRDIGYHVVIELNGLIRYGRPLDDRGAHCRGHNDAIGICYVGGLDSKGIPKDTRTKGQKEAMKSLLLTFQEREGEIEVHGHYEFANKACPCFNVSEEYPEFRGKNE